MATYSAPDSLVAAVLSDLVYHTGNESIAPPPTGWVKVGSFYDTDTGYYGEAWGKLPLDATGNPIPGGTYTEIMQVNRGTVFTDDGAGAPANVQFPTTDSAGITLPYAYLNSEPGAAPNSNAESDHDETIETDAQISLLGHLPGKSSEPLYISKSADNFYQQIRNEYPTLPIIETGQSLGGATSDGVVADKYGSDNDLSAITFNALPYGEAVSNISSDVDTYLSQPGNNPNDPTSAIITNYYVGNEQATQGYLVQGVLYLSAGPPIGNSVALPDLPVVVDSDNYYSGVGSRIIEIHDAPAGVSQLFQYLYPQGSSSYAAALDWLRQVYPPSTTALIPPQVQAILTGSTVPTDTPIQELIFNLDGSVSLVSGGDGNIADAQQIETISQSETAANYTYKVVSDPATDDEQAVWETDAYNSASQLVGISQSRVYKDGSFAVYNYNASRVLQSIYSAESTGDTLVQTYSAGELNSAVTLNASGTLEIQQYQDDPVLISDSTIDIGSGIVISIAMDDDGSILAELDYGTTDSSDGPYVGIVANPGGNVDIVEGAGEFGTYGQVINFGTAGFSDDTLSIGTGGGDFTLDIAPGAPTEIDQRFFDHVTPTFTGDDEILKLNYPNDYGYWQIADFQPGDTIDLLNFPWGGGFNLQGNNSFSIFQQDGAYDTVLLSGDQDYSDDVFVVEPDGAGGENFVAYRSGDTIDLPLIDNIGSIFIGTKSVYVEDSSGDKAIVFASQNPELDVVSVGPDGNGGLSVSVTPNQIVNIGPTDSIAKGISSSGEVVGYVTTAGSSQSSSTAYGFTYATSNFSTFNLHYDNYNSNVPDQPIAINSNGEIIGSYVLGYSSGYYYYLNGSFNRDLPGTAVAINSSGQIVGQIFSEKLQDGVYEQTATGYIYNSTTLYPSYISLNFPGSSYISPADINSEGTVIGTYYDADGSDHGFVYTGGDYATLDAPGSFETIPTAINSAGLITGTYDTGVPNNRTPYGFVYDNGTFVEIPLEDANPVAINSAGEVAGNWAYGGFIYFHGTIDTFGIGGATVFVTDINLSGEVVGYYKEPDGTTQAFETMPVAIADVVSDTAANVAMELDTLQNEAASGSLGSIVLTDSGTPVLSITGAQLSADATALGEVYGALGEVVVIDSAGSAALSGSGSFLNIGVNTLRIADDEAASLAIRDGGRFKAGEIDIAAGSTGSGAITVDGNGTSLKGSGLAVGGSLQDSGGAGQLTISNSAVVDVSDVQVWSVGIITLSDGSLETDPIAINGGTITGNGTISGDITDGGTVIASGGLLEITGSVTGDGIFIILGQSTLRFDGGVASGVKVEFESDGTGVLQLADPSGMQASIAGQISGDEVTEVPCFAAGTYIRRDQDEVAVEDLIIGERVETICGGYAQITWIGHRHVDCRRHIRPKQVWPVRIRAGAFGKQAPHRDLLLSPDHAVFIEGILIPIKYLVNGTTIAQEEWDEVTYYHIELARHDVLLAEGLSCESYLDTGNRANFGGDGVTRLFPDFGPSSPDVMMIWEAKGYAPLVVYGPELDAARAFVNTHAVVRKTAAA